MAPSVHILISTANNVANFVPVIQYVKDGDTAIIIDSESSHRRNWGLGLQAAIATRCDVSIHMVDVKDDDLLSIARSGGICGRIEELLEPQGALYLYLNGGQKPASVGLTRALENAHGERVIFVYLDMHRAVLVETGNAGTEKLVPLSNTVTLSEHLMLYGYELLDGDGPLDPTVLASADSVAARRAALFRSSAPFVSALWKANDVRLMSAATRIDIDDATVKAVRARVVADREVFLPNSIGAPAIKGTLKPFNLPSIPGGMLDCLVDRCQKTGVVVSDFSIARTFRYLTEPRGGIQPEIPLLKEEHAALSEAGLYEGDGDNPALNSTNIRTIRLGPLFEEAVSYRFAKFLKARPHITNQIQAVWQNVKTGKAGTGKIDAEHDLLVLLKCGQVISLECKSWSLTEKDMFARRSKLRNTFGAGSELWIIAPLFTIPKYVRPELVRLSAKVKTMGLSYVPFTLESQPERIPAGVCGEEEISVRSFEDALELMLKRKIAQ